MKAAAALAETVREEQPPRSGGWTNRFGMLRNPFRDSLETDLFFLTRIHEEALIKVRIGIEDGHAVMLLAGAPGTGKTLVTQVVLKTLDPARYETAFVFVHPGMGKGALLAAILKDLGMASPGRLASERLALLQEKALALHAAGRRLVIIIDEAHFLKADALHLLRTLSNLETEDEKLVTLLLVAEESLQKRLAGQSYRSLRGRMTFSARLGAMSAAETKQYIKFRMLKCRAPAHLLDDDVFGVTFAASGGIPREINRLLYNALMEALTMGAFNVTSAMVRQVVDKERVWRGTDK